MLQSLISDTQVTLRLLSKLNLHMHAFTCKNNKEEEVISLRERKGN